MGFLSEMPIPNLGEEVQENACLSNTLAGWENTHWAILKVRKTVKARHARKKERRGNKEMIKLEWQTKCGQQLQTVIPVCKSIFCCKCIFNWHVINPIFFTGEYTVWEAGSLLLVHLCFGGFIATMLLFMLLHACAGVLVHRQAGATRHSLEYRFNFFFNI